MLWACSGCASAANRNREWIAASRALRVRMLLPRVFEMIQERGDQRRVEVFQVQPRRRPGGAGRGVAEQHPPGVAVAAMVCPLACR